MMPPWVHLSPRNDERASAIAAELLEHDFDIVCLQKAFDASAREIIEAAVTARYPHRYGPANDSCGLKLNSGLWVLSRHPLTDYRAIEFDACGGVECFARKGALLVSGACRRTPFRLVVAHLQGEEGPRFTEEHQRIRDAQMKQIRDALVTPYLEPSVPFLLCGDFGTPRFSDEGDRETESYRRMLANFGAENGVEARLTFADDKSANGLAVENSGRRNELDYILLRANGARVDVQRALHIFRRGGWDSPGSARHDLSYRYAVGARVTIDDPSA
jgi:endonuclease/exonuclease/phosphatase family metal-dependent hydrolase